MRLVGRGLDVTSFSVLRRIETAKGLEQLRFQQISVSFALFLHLHQASIQA